MFRRFALVTLLVVTPFLANAYTSPGKPVGLVNDFAKVLSTDQSIALGEKLIALEKSTSDEIVVVTIPSLDGDTIENYANKLFQEWGIGVKGKDNGLLILVSTGDHEARIEVGYGLEGTVTDLQSGNIIRNVMIPSFKTDDYAGGISDGVDAITAIITGSPDAAQYSQQPDSSGTISVNLWGIPVRLHPNLTVIFFFIIFIFNILARILGRTKSWWLGGVLGVLAGGLIGLITGNIAGGIGAALFLGLIGLLIDYIVSKRPPGSGGGGGIWPIFLGNRWGGGSGGSGGGFGGFGGGSSGGGGASGSW